MTDNDLTLSLSAELPDTRIAQLTNDLKRDLSRSNITVRDTVSTTAPGERGDPVTLGVIALALVTSGAVTALIQCLKAYVSREPALSIKLTRLDGTQVEVNARNVDAPAIRATLESMADRSQSH